MLVRWFSFFLFVNFQYEVEVMHRHALSFLIHCNQLLLIRSDICAFQLDRVEARIICTKVPEKVIFNGIDGSASN